MEITVDGRAFRGNLYGNRGAFTSVYGDDEYFGEVRNLCAEGHGVVQLSNQCTYSGQFAKGSPDGHNVYRWGDGDAEYGLFSQGSRMHTARENANGTYLYDYLPCDAADARFAELKMAALEAEVPSPPSDPFVGLSTHLLGVCARQAYARQIGAEVDSVASEADRGCVHRCPRGHHRTPGRGSVGLSRVAHILCSMFDTVRFRCSCMLCRERPLTTDPSSSC
jgi:hypothetical protein